MTKKQTLPNAIRARAVFGLPTGGGGAQNISIFYGESTTIEHPYELILPEVLESKITIIKQDVSTKKD